MIWATVMIMASSGIQVDSSVCFPALLGDIHEPNLSCPLSIFFLQVMRFSVVLFSIVVLVLAHIGSAFTVDSPFRNTRLVRVIDLRGNVVHHDIGIRARNIDTKPVNEYLFTVSPDTSENVADIKAFLRQEPKTDLVVEPVLAPTA